MDRQSLAHTKAHLSEIVDNAEHHGKRTLILRHGKPAAAIVPISFVEETRAKPMTKKELANFLKFAATCGDPNFDAVTDLLAGRR
jgi:prevent-host-death family protein